MNEILDRESWELKTLEEIAADIYIGNEIKKDQLGTGNYPAIKCGDVNSKLEIQFAECISFVDENLIKIKKYFEYGDLLIGKLGDLETSGKVVTYLGKKKGLLGDGVYVLKHNQNPKYLAYVLSTEYCRKQIKKMVKGGTVKCLFIRDIKRIQIPLPPIEIQNLIADYLDKFTEMSRQLEAELEERKIQYEYYRDNIIFGRDEEEMTSQNIRGDSN